MSISIYLALLYLKKILRQGFSSVVIVVAFVGIFLGITIILTVIPIMDGFHYKFQDIITGFQGHIKILVHKDDFNNPDDRENFLNKINDLENVKEVYVSLQNQTIAINDNWSLGVLCVGIDQDNWENNQFFRQHILHTSSNDFDLKDPSQYKIFIGKGMASKLSLNLGDSLNIVNLYGSKTIVGNIPSLKKFEIAGIFNTGLLEIDNNIIFMNLTQSQLFFNKKDQINIIEIFLHRPYDLAVVKNIITENYPFLTITDWQLENQELFQALQMESNIMLILLFLIVIVATFKVMVGMVMFIERQMQSIGILLTIGASNMEIINFFLFIGLIVGSIAMILGNVLAYFLVINVNEILNFIEQIFGLQIFNINVYQLSSIPYYFSHIKIIFINLITFMLIICSTLIPILLIIKKQPIKLLIKS